MLTYLAITRLGPRIEPITFPTPGGFVTSYATDAGVNYRVASLLKINMNFYYLFLCKLGMIYFKLFFCYLQIKMPKTLSRRSTPDDTSCNWFHPNTNRLVSIQVTWLVKFIVSTQIHAHIGWRQWRNPVYCSWIRNTPPLNLFIFFLLVFMLILG